MSKKLLGNHDQGLLFILSAPAGTGKSTLVEMLIQEFPGAVSESCSSTTREKRFGEVEGQHYHFISHEEFERKIQEGAFLEHARVFSHLYGTPIAEIERLQKTGKHVVLVIDTQGAKKIKEKGIKAIFIFIIPPSLEELKNRLFKRRTENEEKIQERLEWAEREIEQAKQYDYTILNEDLQISYQILRSIFIAEENKVR